MEAPPSRSELHTQRGHASLAPPALQCARVRATSHTHTHALSMVRVNSWAVVPKCSSALQCAAASVVVRSVFVLACAL
eukprot:3127995-Pleurochrysis_carterae.AAC.1